MLHSKNKYEPNEVIAEHPAEDEQIYKYAKMLDLQQDLGFKFNLSQVEIDSLQKYHIENEEEFLKMLIEIKQESDSKRMQFYIKLNTVIEEERNRNVRITKQKNLKPIVAHWKGQHECHAIDREKAKNVEKNFIYENKNGNDPFFDK